MGVGETIGISVISAVVTSYLAYYFGFKQYVKQRIREEIREDYIRNGLDKVINTLNKASFLRDFNFGKVMRVIEYLEKTLIDRKMGKKEIKKVFSEMDTFPIAPPSEVYKIQLLTGYHKELFSWITESLVDYFQYDNYLRHELFINTTLYFNHPDKFEGKEKEFFKTLRREIQDIYKKVSLNEPLKVHLLNLRIRIDEIEICSMKDFDKKVLQDKKIKEILKEIKKDYKKLESKNEKIETTT